MVNEQQVALHLMIRPFFNKLRINSIRENRNLRFNEKIIPDYSLLHFRHNF